MQLLPFFIYLCLCPFTNAFYYYSKTGDRKCFQKELRKDTYIQGKYVVSIHDSNSDQYRLANNNEISVTLDIEEIFDNNERVVHQTGSPNGDFTFVALESGEHRICLQIQSTSWLNKIDTQVDLKFESGSDSKLDSKKKKTLETLQDKVNVLVSKVVQIKLEQKLMRDREAQFRDLSENVNSGTMWWGAFQLIVLGITCVWQMKHLATFFVKQKVL